MKKIFNAPDILELDFKETAVTCGAKGKKLTMTSGTRLMSTKNYSTNSWFIGLFGGTFGDETEPDTFEEYDE